MQPTWTSIVREAVKDTAALSYLLDQPVAKLDYPLFIPRPFLEKIKKAGPKSALWKQFIPHENEQLHTGGLFDPIADQKHSPTPMIVHRYEKKCLFLPTTVCPVICRYCFRKNELAEKSALFQSDYQAAFDYLRSHEEIEEVIFSGGDPFMLSTKKLSELVAEISQIKHIRYLRFHTRFPMIIPERFDEQTLQWLQNIQTSFERVSFVVHANHASEFDDQVEQALRDIGRTGTSVFSQSVLLSGINDSVEDLTLLFKAIIKAKVQPYYLHHPDDALGAQHFRLELEKGAELYAETKKLLPGWAVPRYVVEQAQGLGKIDVLTLV